MKIAIVIPDGCADEPQSSLGGKTPLQAAQIPAMDRVAAEGTVGLSCNTPHHLPAGSDVANMSLLGYDPNAYFTGRAPLEAADLLDLPRITGAGCSPDEAVYLRPFGIPPQALSGAGPQRIY